PETTKRRWQDRSGTERNKRPWSNLRSSQFQGLILRDGTSCLLRTRVSLLMVRSAVHPSRPSDGEAVSERWYDPRVSNHEAPKGRLHSFGRIFSTSASLGR